MYCLFQEMGKHWCIMEAVCYDQMNTQSRLSHTIYKTWAYESDDAFGDDGKGFLCVTVGKHVSNGVEQVECQFIDL